MNASDWLIFIDVEWEEEYRKNRQHFLVEALSGLLLEGSKILCVERPVDLFVTPALKKDRFCSFLRGRKGLRKARENLFVYTPCVPLHNIAADRLPLLGGINRWLLKRQIGRILDRLFFRTDNQILWVQHPYQLGDLSLFPARATIYDCHDDYANVPGDSPQWRKEIQRREEELLKRVDWVLATSDSLYERLRQKHPQVVHLPNGVDFDHFSQARDSGLPLAEEISEIPHPIIGLVGKITERLDFELLLSLVQEGKNWSFVFVGPTEGEERFEDDRAFQQLLERKNCYFLGPSRYRDLPRYIKGFDVCIIPYKRTPFNLASDPLKVYEYLAAGKVVVSTIPSTRGGKLGRLLVCDGPDEFRDAVAVALERGEDEVELWEGGKSPQDTWVSRVRFLLECLGR